MLDQILNLFKTKEKDISAELAKNRLKVSIEYEKKLSYNHNIKQLQEEIIKLIEKFQEVENTNIHLNSENNLEIEVVFKN